MGKTVRAMTLVVPGLLGPLPGADAPGFPRPTAPAAERLLARGRRASMDAESYETVLCGQFGLHDPAESLPVAAITRLADTGERNAACWLRADPVHLRADQDRLILFDDQALHIQPEEAGALLARLENLYGNEADWHLEAPVANRWYLRCERAAGLRTTPLSQVIGHPVGPHLPRGANATHWHTLLNEIQMLVHEADVNLVREAQGRPTINSVWFWGAGRLPQVPATGWRGVWSDDPLATGLASLTGVAHCAAPASAAQWLMEAEPGAHLVALDNLKTAVSYGDVEAWVERVQHLEEAWLAPLAQALGRGRLRELEIQPCNGYCYRLGRGGVWRLWRRSRPLAGGGR